MDTKQTPGPWKYANHEIWGSNSVIVAEMNETSNVTLDTSAANARLIASAPDLLDAVQALVFHMETPAKARVGLHARPEYKAHLLKTAKQAIAKAEGR